MRSLPLAMVALTAALSFAACKLIWGYDDFKDQPGTGGRKSVVDAGIDAPEEEKTPNGGACEAGVDCQSGDCASQADGGTVCCAGPCGTCETCDGEGGTCVAVPGSAPGPGCSGSMVCDGDGGCKIPNGGACTMDMDAGVCLSGACVNAVCCAAACPACQTCAGDGSGCTPLAPSTPDPRCTTADMICDGAGNCV